MNGLALCAGAGGLELGLSLALGDRIRTVCYVEWEAYAAATLVARMEDKAMDQAPVWDNVKTFDGRAWRGKVDILSAGYPCQSFSVAGQRKGKEDPRHLWPHIARIIKEVQPGWVFLENVAGHVQLGLTDVISDLNEMGFDAEWGCYTASGLGASHKRERLFVLGHTKGIHKGRLPIRKKKEYSMPRKPGGALADPPGNNWGSGICKKEAGIRQDEIRGRGSSGGRQIVADSRSRRSEGSQSTQRGESNSTRCGGDLGNAENLRRAQAICRQSKSPFPPGPGDREAWARILETAPTLEPAVCGMADGMAHRVDRLRLCGNGVVPVVAAVAYLALRSRID